MKRSALAFAAVAAVLCLMVPRTGFAQDKQEKKGAFIDGEYVKDYVYVPDFMSPEELKKDIGRMPPTSSSWIRERLLSGKTNTSSAP